METLVLIHGIPGSHGSWDRVAERLAPANDVVVPDLLGFGRSPRPDELHAEAQAAALEDALGRAGIKRATIVGHDVGGPISLSLYRRRPDLFGSLALMATNAFPDTPIPFPLSTITLPVVGNVMARSLFSSPALMLWADYLLVYPPRPSSGHYLPLSSPHGICLFLAGRGRP